MTRYPNHTPILLFTLDNLQVYHYQSPEEFAVKASPKIVYWQDVVAMKAHGPFDSINAAMTHYRDYLEAQNTIVSDPPPQNIIYVDFKLKKRIK